MKIHAIARHSMAAMVLVGSALATAPAVYAHQSGDFIVRAGVAGSRITHDLNFSETVGNLYGRLSPRKSSAGGILNVTAMLSDYIGLDLMVSRFENKIQYAENFMTGAARRGTFAKFQQVPIALNLVLYPMGEYSDFQPYVGAGVQYSVNKLKLTSAGTRIANALIDAGVDDVDEYDEIENRFGFSAVAGVDYNFTDDWLLNAQVRYLHMSKSEDSLKSRTVYALTLGYRF